MEGLTESEKLLLYTMFGFVGLLAIAMIASAITSFRANKAYNSWKEAKSIRLATLKAALISRENFDGYIVLAVDEENKSLLHDVLKGFEEFVLLKGYKIKLSINVEEPDKILLKISEVGVSRTKKEDEIRNDLEEYITKIRNGELFEEIPRLIDPVYHERVILALKNRLYFLQTNYEVEKNIRVMYENILHSIEFRGPCEKQTTTINIAGIETTMDKRKYVSNHSSNVIQGDVQDSLVSVGSKLKIEKSFAGRKNQIDGLKSLVGMIKKNTSDESEIATKNLEKVIEELEEEESPNVGMIEKWLNKAGTAIGLIEKGGKLFAKAKEVYENFGIPL
jgi:hypothetical protein